MDTTEYMVNGLSAGDEVILIPRPRTDGKKIGTYITTGTKVKNDMRVPQSHTEWFAEAKFLYNDSCSLVKKGFLSLTAPPCESQPCHTGYLQIG